MKKLLLLLLLAAPIWAQSCVTVSDTLYVNGDSSLGTMTGTIDLTLGYTTTSGGATVVQNVRRVTVTAGVVSVCLAPGNYTADYTVRRPSPLNGNTSYRRYWVVPSSGPVTVNTIETETAPTPTLTVAITQLSQGGATNGQCLTWSTSSLAWVPSACSSGGVWGAITGTLTDQTDLVSALSGKLAAASNLSDLANAGTARTNLGLGTAATQNSTAFLAAGGTAVAATALASNPTDCTAGQYATAIDASGNLTCSQVGNTTGNAATSTALAANGTNCSSGNYPLGVDASGNAESCTAVPTVPANTTSTSNQFFTAYNSSTGVFTKAQPSASNLSDGTTGSGSVVLATSPTLTTPKIGQINDTNGNAAVALTATTSAVDYLTIANAAAGGTLAISATGSDSNIPVNIASKGTGVVSFRSGTSGGTENMRLIPGAQLYLPNMNAVQIKSNITIASNTADRLDIIRPNGADCGTAADCRDLKLRHLLGGGTAPTISSGFGTSPAIAGTDTAIRLTVGTGGVATSGVIAFGTAYGTAPVCTVSPETTIIGMKAAASTTQLTITAASAWTASDVLDIHCIGY